MPDYESGGQEFESLRARQQVSAISPVFTPQLGLASMTSLRGSNMEAQSLVPGLKIRRLTFLCASSGKIECAPAAQQPGRKSYRHPHAAGPSLPRETPRAIASAISLVARVPSSRAGEALPTH